MWQSHPSVAGTDPGFLRCYHNMKFLRKTKQGDDRVLRDKTEHKPGRQLSSDRLTHLPQRCAQSSLAEHLGPTPISTI